MQPASPARRVFVSHSHADNVFSRRLVEDLRKAGLDVWYDEQDLSGGSTHDTVIQRELHQRDAFIVVMSPTSVDSRWVHSEWNEALEQLDHKHMGYVIPVIAAPCTLPIRLKTMIYVDFTTQPYELALGTLLRGLGLQPGPTSQASTMPAPSAPPLPVVWEQKGAINTQSGCYAIDWSPDGRYIAAGTRDHKVRIWEVATSQCVQTFIGHENWVDAVKWSPDGKRIASASEGTRLRLWDVASGKQSLLLTGHTASVKDVAWSPDGAELVSGSEDRTVRIWNAASGLCRLVIQGPTQPITSVAWSPGSDLDSTFIAATARDALIRVWSANSGGQAFVLAGHKDVVHRARWSPDGRLLASVGNTSLRLWDVRNGNCLQRQEVHKGLVVALAWRPDGRLIATGSADRTIRLWGLQGERIVVTPGMHADWVHDLTWSPDGAEFASCGGNQDGIIKVWAPAV